MSEAPESRPDRPAGSPPGRGGWLWMLLGGLALAALIAYLVARFPDAISSRDDQTRLVYLVLLLVLVASAVVVRWRSRPKLAARQALVWIGIALVLFLGYSYRFELMGVKDRVLGELMPHQGIETGTGTVSFRVASDGHFHIEATVDGTPVRFMVDTGASDVVLRPADARRLGFDLDRLAYTKLYHTANGTVRAAPVRLREIVIGPLVLRDVRASVTEAPMDTSLLGMSLLERLTGFEIRDKTLTLTR